MKKFNQVLPYLLAAVLFIAIAVIYCKPVLEGKVIYQGDVKQWQGMAQETLDYHQKTGHWSFWTNSMFSGMPTYQIAGSTTSSAWLKPLHALSGLFFNSVLAILIGYFVGFFIMMRAFGVNKWLSIVGALAVAFSSYFFIIIPAGHESKAYTLGLMAPVVAGFFLIFRKKYGWGVSLTMVYAALGLMKHPQMSYYIFMMLGVFAVAEVAIHIREKRVKDLCLGALIFLLSLGIGVGTGYAKLRSNQEYVKETMRGGHSELTKDLEEMALADDEDGLSLEYATQWSYGVGETMTLLIPNVMGGSSNYKLGTDSHVYKAMIANRVPAGDARNMAQSLPMYWGDQPFTSGPVYVGALVCLLFVLGLFLVKGPYKWALLAATVLSVLLSWGHNFMGLTRFFYQYFPFYSKFRTVSSILVVAELTIPLLGFLGLKAATDGSVDKPQVLKALFRSVYISAGLCLLVALFGPALFSFAGASDVQLGNLPDWFMDAIRADRISMMRGDAIRSLIFILLGAGTLWLYLKEKIKFPYMVALCGVLVLADMWPVNKRFFNDDNFVSKKEDTAYFAKQPYEEQILQDPELYFRVFNVASNTFNDARTSYYLKSVGGYHAAKLRRYQDLIDQHLSTGNQSVVDMLNVKYLIGQTESGRLGIQENTTRLGNAWFVDRVEWVDTPDQESDLLHELDLATTAVADKRFASLVGDRSATPSDAQASITLTSYAPDVLTYTSHAAASKVAIFSDIYYPYGWKATIDGQPVDHFRANYVLRALLIPAGDHEIRFAFEPDAIRQGNKVSIAFIVLMYVLIGVFMGMGIYRRRF